MQGENPLPLPPSQTDTDDPPCITGAVPPPGREVDVVDEADEIDVARITGRRTGLRGTLGVAPGVREAPGWRLDDVGDVENRVRSSSEAFCRCLAKLRPCAGHRPNILF